MSKLKRFEESFNELTYPLHHPFYVRCYEWYEDKGEKYWSSITVIKVDIESIEPYGVEDYMINKNFVFRLKDSIETSITDYQNILHLNLIGKFCDIEFENGKDDNEQGRIQ